MHELMTFFNTYSSDNNDNSSKEMSLILKALPSSLKTHMAKFMYQDAISIHKFL